MISPCPVLAGYRLVESGPCVCLSSMYVQNLSAAHASAVVSLHSLSSVLDYFLVSLSFMACPIWGWALLDGGLCFFLSPPFFLLLSFLLRSLFCFNLSFILPLMTQQDHWFLCYTTSGLLCSICFPLGVPDPFTFLGLPRPFS